MARAAPLRVLAVALGLSVLSFALGVAGDLSGAEQPRNSGVRVVLRIPPEAPAANAQPPSQSLAPRPQARALRRPLLATAAAEAATPQAMSTAMEAELLHALPSGEVAGALIG